MSQPTQEQRLQSVHERAIREFNRVQTALRNERLQCLKDRRFYSIAGAQWEGPLGEQFENKPRFEMNKIHLAVLRIINEYRNNRVSVDFTPKDGAQEDKLADTCDGLYRADEQDSGAEEAYDNAFEEAVGGGFGAFRLRACYEDEYDDDNDKQRIRFEPIYDADSSVYFDLDAKRQDKADAKRCWVLSSQTHDGYIEEWGDDPSTWPKLVHQWEFDWLTPNLVFVAKYYEVEETSELMHVFRGLSLNKDEPNEIKVMDSELKEDPDKLDKLKATGFREVRQKRVKRRRVHSYIMSGKGILEDEGYLPGDCIPVIPVYGKRWFIDNIERCMGHVRTARDPQMLKNMLTSLLADISTYSPIEKPIFTPEQIAGHTIMWAEDSVKRYPYMLLNSVKDAQGNIIQNGPVAYTKPPSIPEALAGLMQITEQDLQDLLGNQQAGEEVQPNISGKALELIQNRLDMQAFIYMDNFKKSIRRAGEVWLSMAKDIYVEDGRLMKTIASDGSAGQIELNKPMVNEDGEDYSENDLSEASFDVVSDVGPASSSRRAATARQLISMLQFIVDPDAQKVLTGLIMMNMEGEGMGDVRDYFRSQLVQIGAVQPTKEEAAELQQQAQNQQPDPQAVYLQASAQEAMARAGKAQAETVLTQAQVGKTRADTVKTLSEVATDHQDRAIDAAAAIREAHAPQQPINR